MAASSQTLTSPPLRDSVADYEKPSIARVIVWTILFQLAWNIRSLPSLLTEGRFSDPDDFLRLHQVRNWMDGQGWFDVSVPRMSPPLGGDMHWSRLVDVPLAGLTWFFNLFTEAEMAERLAAMAWPTLLLIPTVLILIAVCEKLYPAVNRLLVLLFVVTCNSAMIEFAPGRIDHHNIQILLFSLILLGLVNSDRKWGHFLIGGAMALSIVIGLDLVAMLALILAWLGIEWVLGMDRNGTGLFRTGLALIAGSALLYPVSVPYSQWLEAWCDANSTVYLTAFWAIGTGFVFLSAISTMLPTHKIGIMIATRAIAGILAGLMVLGLMYRLYPQCAAGPLSEISPELNDVWLVTIVEAKGVITAARILDVGLYAMPAFILFILAIGLAMIRYKILHPHFIVIWAAIAITFVLGFLQFRMLRIGMFATVPVSVITVQLAWQWFSQRYDGNRVMAVAAAVCVAIVMISPVWQLMGSNIAKAVGATDIPKVETADLPDDLPEWASDPDRKSCNYQSDFARLAAMPGGHVFNDINIGPALLLHTDHTIVGANYHRNEDVILDTFRFFKAQEDKALDLAIDYSADYVALCKHHPLSGSLPRQDGRLGAMLMHGIFPDWLEPVSTPDDRLLVARVKR